MKQFTAKLALLTALLALSTAAFAEPPRSTPGTERFDTPQQQAAPAPQKKEQSGDLITAKRMTEIYADEYAKRCLIAGDLNAFKKPWKIDMVKTVMRFYSARWWPDQALFDSSDPAQQRARDMYSALWAYSLEAQCRRQMYRLLLFITASNLTERLRKLYVSFECFDWANDNLLPMLKRFDEAYNSFMFDIQKLNSNTRLSYGSGSGELPLGWQIFDHSGMGTLMSMNLQPKPSFDRAIRTLDQACAVCKKSTLDDLKAELQKLKPEIDASRTAFQIAVGKIEKLPGYNDVMYICSADDDIINAAEELYNWGMKMLKDLDDNGTIYGKMRHFIDIGRYGGLDQDGVSYSGTGVPVYRRKVRRGVEEMKKAYEKWAADMNRRYDNLKGVLHWSY